MTVAPLFAPVLPPAPSSARLAQGDGPSDLAGLFALLLAGAPLVQAAVARGADTGAPAAPELAPALAGDFPPAVPRAPSAQQPLPVAGVIGAAADALPPVSPLPAIAAPVAAALAPASAPPELAPASPDASFGGPGYAPSADFSRAAPQPSLADPVHAVTQTPGPAPAPLTMPLVPLGSAQIESAAPIHLEMASIAPAAGQKPPAAPSGLSLQTGADPTDPAPAAPRQRPLAAAGARSVATSEPMARRPHISILAPDAGSPGAACDQAAASDQAWLEPDSEAAEGAVTRADHTVADGARAPAAGRPVPPAPVFQIGMQIAKAVPGRIDRLVVQLEPAALGRVEVRLKFQRNDQVSAVIAAERPDTLEALQRDARLLERSLQQAGLRLDSDGLTFSLKREQAHHQAREDNWFAPSASERADRPLPAARDEPPAVYWFRGMRALDIRV